MSKKPIRRVVIIDPVDWPESMNEDINMKLLQACNVLHVAIAREALSQGADVNCKTSDFLTPLHIATEHNDVELVQLLCDQPSINIDAKTLHGVTPLHKATLLEHSDVIRTLLENGAAVNCTDGLGRSPLHYAALTKNVENADILIRNGADINIYDTFHETPLYTSIIYTPSVPMIKLLLSHGATVHSPPNQKSLSLFLEVLLFVRNESGMKIVDLLFQNGADVNTMDCIGLRTPLHIAAVTGNVQLATYLIEKGADVHRKNRVGRTPMEVAKMYGNFKVAKLIEDYLSTK